MYPVCISPVHTNSFTDSKQSQTVLNFELSGSEQLQTVPNGPKMVLGQRIEFIRRSGRSRLDRSSLDMSNCRVMGQSLDQSLGQSLDQSLGHSNRARYLKSYLANTVLMPFKMLKLTTTEIAHYDGEHGVL